MPVPSWAELGLLFNIMISLSCMFCVKYSWFCIIFFGYFKFWQIQGVKNKPFLWQPGCKQTHLKWVQQYLTTDTFHQHCGYEYLGGLLLRLLTHIFPFLGSVWFISSQLNEVFPSAAPAAVSQQSKQKVRPLMPPRSLSRWSVLVLASARARLHADSLSL